MITKIQNSVNLKFIALLLAVSFLSMSFKMNRNGEVVLNAGTPISLETVSMIESSRIAIGQTVDFRVRYDVKVEGETVIKAGSIAKGQVVRAQMAKGLGKEGFIEVKVKSVTAVDGQEVYLSGGNLYQEGENKETLAIVLGLFVCILFLTMKGKEAQVPAGYEVNPSVASTVKIKV